MGVRQALFTASGRSGGENGYLSLAVRRKRNGVDVAKFKIAASNPDMQYIIDKNEIQIVRSDPAIGLAEYSVFTGLIRDLEYRYENGGINTLVTAYGANHLLSWREILWYSGYEGRSQFTNVAGETVFKNLVTYNCTASASTANGRDRLGTITGVSVAADSARGNAISIACSRQNLLATLQKYARIANIDFALTRTAAGVYSFDVYPNQLGTDRTATMLFALNRNNMGNPALAVRRSTERTVAIVGGTAEGPARKVRTVTGAYYNVSTNNIELFVDAREHTANDILDDLGSAALIANQLSYQLTYDVLQAEGSYVDLDYTLGDRVRAGFAGYTVDQIVDTIDYEYKPNIVEDIKIGMVDL